MFNVTRRTFLKSTAALGAITAAMGAATPLVALADDGAAPAKKIVKKHMWCNMCGLSQTYCGTLCTVEDGVFTHVEGNPLAGSNNGHGTGTLCAKGNAATQLVYDPSRILYPMKLIGEKGSGKFERITWDEALDTIAKELMDSKEKYGPEAFAVLSGQYSECVDSMAMRFLSIYGSPNWCHNGICWDQRETTKACVIGKAATFPRQIDKTKLLVVWGSNKENTGINQSRALNFERLDETERGMVTIDIRPSLNTFGAHSDIWVPVRPATDGALALAILHILIEEDLYDHDFVENWCYGFDKLAEHVKQFTPEWASNHCGVPVEQIYQIARMMGTMKPMALIDGNGFGDQENDGTWTATSIFLIQAITGNLDIPGGNGASLIMPAPMVKLSDMSFGRSGLWMADRIPESEEDRKNGWQPGASKLIAPEFPRWLYGKYTYSISSCNPRVLEALDSDQELKPHVIFSHATNSMSCLRQPKRVAELLKKIPFHFIMDTHWNESCNYADIVLPASTQYECSDQVAVSNQLNGTFIAVNTKIIEPLGESMSDYKIYAELAKRCGMANDWWGGDSDGMLRQLLEGTGITLEELRAANEGIFIERPVEERVMKEPEYQNYEKLFSTLPHNKVQCYNEVWGGKTDNTDKGTLGYLPEYVGPTESLGGTPELAKEYPFVLSDVHGHRLAEHSHRNNCPWLREIEPYPWCKINTTKAAEYGIKDGDWMKLESPHGWCVLTAKCTEGIAPDVLMTRRGWWQDCQSLGLPGYDMYDGGCEANVMYASDPDNWDKFSSAASKQTLVKISKWDGEIKTIEPSEFAICNQNPELLDGYYSKQEA